MFSESEFIIIIIIIIIITGGWDSSVSIAICYVVGSPKLRPPVGKRFFGPMQKFPEEQPVSSTMSAGLFAGDWRLPCIVGVECR